MTSDPLVKQLEDLIQEITMFEVGAKGRAMDTVKQMEILTRGCAAIRRIAGKDSVYHQQAEAIRAGTIFSMDRIKPLYGVLRSLYFDLKAGYLQSFEELIHGEMFSDFLDMASHLVQSGYKDASAVIAGSSLEAHLRQLAKRWSIPVVQTTSRGVEPKKADTLNADLVKAGGYSMLDQKNVTAWLDLRNKAAHGKYADYQKEQVVLMIDAIRDFIARCPA